MKSELIDLCPQPSGTIDWDAILEVLPILKSLEGVEQNPLYHGEGDVLAHTKMAAEYLVNQCKEWRELVKWERDEIFMAVLLHDVGKLECTVEENGVPTSKGHASKGAKIARRVLWDFYRDEPLVGWFTREQIATMVLLHMNPFYLVESDDPLRFIASASTTVGNQKLRILCESDAYGRITSADSEVGIRLDMFKTFCEEHDCYKDPISFFSDNDRFRYFFERKGHPKCPINFPPKQIVYMLSGIAGSGKDTVYRNCYGDLPMVSLDAIRTALKINPLDNQGKVLQAAKEQCREYMRDNKKFVFNATNLIKSTRAKWIRLFNDYNYQVFIDYVEPPFNIIQAQNSNREDSVPDHVLCKMFKDLEVPTPLECHQLFVNDGNEIRSGEDWVKLRKAHKRGQSGIY